MKKKKMGRPSLPQGENRNKALTIRLKEFELNKLLKAAKKGKKSLSEWARNVLTNYKK